MKLKLIALILLTVFLVSCGPDGTPEEEVQDETEESTEEVSECDRITDPSRKIRCQAWEAEDMSMCADIPISRFREDCVMVAAEIVQDESQLEHCSISEVGDYRIACRALIKKDVSLCFAMEESLSHASDLVMRGCIDLVSRKLRDKETCKAFSTHVQDLIDACGSSTSDCEGRWISGMQDNIEQCEAAIDTALSYDQ